MAVLLLLAAVLLSLWSAGVAGDAISFGNAIVLLALALACFAASFLPWWPAITRTPR
jgi:hypothetical protein